MTFEQTLERLEAIVRELERTDVDLDRALTLFEEGIGHLRGAGQSLQAVEKRVQLLVEAADGSLSLAPMEDA
jgi:exodeoxyribonuclease VII small subunit